MWQAEAVVWQTGAVAWKAEAVVNNFAFLRYRVKGRACLNGPEKP